MGRGFSLFIFIFLVGVTISFGGNDDVPGYIITLDNDTIDGTISIEEGKGNPTEVLFIKPGSIDPLVYSPVNIKEFGTEKEIYKSAIVRTNGRINPDMELPVSRVIDYILDTLFLQVVVSGEKELLIHEDEYGVNNFFIPSDEDYRWLVHSSYYKVNNGKKTIAYNNNYIGQLILYLNGCSNINRVVSGTEYNLNSLRKVFEYYYSCINTEVEIKKPDPAIDVKLSAIAGLTITKISFSGVGVEYLTDVGYPWAPMVSGGISADLFFPKTIGNRWSINNELFAVSYGVKGTYDEELSSNSRRTTETQLGSTYIKLANMFRANFSINYSSIFIDIGVVNGYAVGATNKLKEATYIDQQVSYKEGKAIDSLKKYELSMLFGVGIHGEKLSGMIRYEIGGGVSGDSDIDSSMSRFYFLLSYRFLK